MSLISDFKDQVFKTIESPEFLGNKTWKLSNIESAGLRIYIDGNQYPECQEVKELIQLRSLVGDVNANLVVERAGLTLIVTPKGFIQLRFTSVNHLLQSALDYNIDIELDRFREIKAQLVDEHEMALHKVSTYADTIVMLNKYITIHE